MFQETACPQTNVVTPAQWWHPFLRAALHTKYCPGWELYIIWRHKPSPCEKWYEVFTPWWMTITRYHDIFIQSPFEPYGIGYMPNHNGRGASIWIHRTAKTNFKQWLRCLLIYTFYTPFLHKFIVFPGFTKTPCWNRPPYEIGLRWDWILHPWVWNHMLSRSTRFGVYNNYVIVLWMGF